MVASRGEWVNHETRLIELDGDSIEFLECGNGQPLVLLPGLAGGVCLLGPLIRELSARFRVIACQLRGESWSFCERPFGLRELVDDLQRLISTLRLERPALFGVSFGGAIALEYAARRPGNLSFLAIQGAGLYFRNGLFSQVARSVLSRLPLEANNPFLNQVFRVLAGGVRRDREQIDFITRSCWDTDQSVMARRFSLLEEYDIRDKLECVDLPALVVSGEQDILVQPDEAALLAKSLPQASLATLERAGHFAFVTHASQISQSLADFNDSLRYA